MNKEQREKLLQEIYRLEGLLKYALRHDETEEAHPAATGRNSRESLIAGRPYG